MVLPQMVKQKVGVGNSYGDKGLSDRDGPLSAKGDDIKIERAKGDAYEEIDYSVFSYVSGCIVGNG